MNSTAKSCDPIEAILAEYLTRLDNGEQPGSAEYLARYPEHAEELAQFFSASDYLESKLFEAGKSRSGLLPRESARPSTRPEIEGFEILAELGSGSQGVVYKAVQHGTKRLVALKVIRDTVFASQKDRSRFSLEVELASRLQHPNIAAVYETGELSGRAYYAMQYVEGDPLDVYLGTRTLTMTETLSLFLQICDAVAYAHQRGVIHRDLKPSNMIVDETGAIHLVDFGLAKAVAPTSEEESAHVTQVGDFAGTWYYASPEQVKRDPALVDIRTDVYALGVILYELLTDCYPYELPGGSSSDIANQILAADPIRPRTIRRDIDSDLETITLRALEKERDRRYQSAPAMSDDIRRYLRGDAIEARRDSALYVLRKTLRRHRLAVALALGAIVALAVVAVTVFVLYTKERVSSASLEGHLESRREAEQYVSRKLDNYHRIVNRLAENPGLIDQIFPSRPDESSQKEFEEILRRLTTMSAAAETPDQAPTSPGDDSPGRRLDAIDALLIEIRSKILEEGFALDLRPSTGSNKMLYDRPRALDLYQGVSSKLCDLALREARSDDFVAAAASLSAVRKIGIEFGDGRLIHYKSMSVGVRTRTYNVVLRIFEELGEDRDLSLIVQWALDDVPLVGYRLGLIHERTKLAQIYAPATFADQNRDGMHVDIETLERDHDFLSNCTVEDRKRIHTAADATTWTDLLRLIDDTFEDQEQWDPLSYEELSLRDLQQKATREAHPAWPLLKPKFSPPYLGFRQRARARSIRAAMLVSAYLVRYRLEHGHWPRELSEEIIPIGVIDPYTNKSFGYRLLDGRPLLYSYGEDLTDNDGHQAEEIEDNAGRQRNWSDAGTDVVLLDMR